MDDDRERPTDLPKRPRARVDGSEPSQNEAPAKTEAWAPEDDDPSAPGPTHDDEAPDADKVRTPPPRKRRLWKWLLWIGGALIILLGASAVAIAAYWDVVARALIVSEAAAHGVSLEFTSAELTRNGLSVDRAKLSGVRVTLASIPGMTVTADDLTIDLVGLAPNKAVATKVHASFAAAPGVSIDLQKATAALQDFAPRSLVVEDATVTADDLSALIDLSNVTMSKPVTAIDTSVKKAHVHVKRLSNALPLDLTIEIQGVERKADATVLMGLSTRIPILDLPVELASVELRANGAALSITIPTAPDLTLSVADRGRKIDVSVARVPADLLAEKLGWSRPPNFALSASATLLIPDSVGAQVTGSYQATLDHYVPPHPRELDGIVFGDSTKASGSFSLAGDHALLTNLKVTAGELELKGDGSASIASGGRLELKMDGSVPCADLAASAVGAHLGLGAAFFTGQLARGHLTGTVGVHLGVVIEGKDAAHPKVSPSAVIHCGLAL